MAYPSLEKLLEALGETRVQSPTVTRARCPVHKGDGFSLDIKDYGEGRYNVTCYAKNCTPLAVFEALNLDAVGHEEPLTVEALAEAKGFTVEELQSWGVTKGVNGNERRPCVDIPYMAKNGAVVRTQKRLSLYAFPRFIWGRGSRVIPYGLWLMDHIIRENGYVVFVEGTTDAWAGWSAGVPCIGIPGATIWKSEWASDFQGLNAYAFCEPGDAGEKFVARIARDLPGLKVITAPPEAKDLCALRQFDPEGFRGRLQTLILEAVPYQATRDAETRALLDKARADAAPLLGLDDLVPALTETITTSGFAGDARPAVIVFMGLVSRLLSDPLNIGIIAQSASGKNAAIDAALPLFPVESYYVLNASTPRVLIYSEEEFKHRIVVVLEADSLPEDGPAASAVRSLMDGQGMRYEVVEKDNDGRFTVREIYKEGPTGLITTSTRDLKAQATTRTLTLSISDAEELTREILRQQALAAEGKSFAVETKPWVALQTVLTLEGPLYEVVIPYASRLAEGLSARAVIMRRAHSHLLTAIKAFAVLRQHQRDRDSKGRLIASAQDYREARWLLEEVFAATASEGLTPAIRATIEAVKANHDQTLDGRATTEAKVMALLDLARTSVQYRVNRAIAKGWLLNTAAKGQTKQLWPAADIPEANALPAVDYVCNQSSPNGSAIGQSGPGTASSLATEGAELFAQSLPTAEPLPNGYSAGSAGPSSRAGESAEVSNENVTAVHTHEKGEVIVAWRNVCMELAGALDWPQIDLMPYKAGRLLGGEVHWRSHLHSFGISVPEMKQQLVPELRRLMAEQGFPNATN